MIQAIAWFREHSILPMLAVFVLILVTTYWPGRKKQIEEHGMIPLKDEF